MFDEHHEPGRRAAYDTWPTGGPDRFGGPGPRMRGRGRGRGGPFPDPGGFRGGPGGRGRGRGRGRARRGDVRAAILALAAERPMHGYEMIQELGERTGGTWTPSPGSVYPTLQLLEEEGHVVGEEVDGKRRFAVTDSGRAEVEGREGPPPWEQVLSGAEPAVLELRDVLGTTMAAVQQVFRAGTPTQQAKAVEVLSDARRKLYEILASEE